MAVRALRKTQKPLKILMTSDAVGGVWQYSLDLIRGLGKNAEVLLATLGPRPSTEQKRQLRNLPQVQLCEGDYALEWMPHPWRDVEAAGKWLLALDSEFKADVIHLNGYAHAALPWRKPVIVVAHSCVYSWWQAVHGYAPGPEWAEYYRCVADGLSACDTVVAPSRFMAGEIKRVYNVPPDKIHVIYNFSSAPEPCAAKEPFCLAAGRLWDQAKNLSLLTAIAPHLRWPMRLAQDLPHRELLECMSRASIFLHPALYEPFGLSALEAARAGCCLILADIASLRELWSGCAIFIDPRQPDQWVRQLNQLSLNPQESRDRGEAARKHAARYSEKNATGAYLNLYCREVQA
jgi:glycosyltransferase involved in cell wall biosynthesis